MAKIKFPDETLPCKVWLEHHSLSTGLGYGISFFIGTVNNLLATALRNSSKLEGHHTETEQLGSAFSKMWIVQFFNTALILILINNRISSDGFIKRVLGQIGVSDLVFSGEYYEFSSEWYKVIGITIFTSAVINGFTPASAVSKWAKRSWK